MPRAKRVRSDYALIPKGLTFPSLNHFWHLETLAERAIIVVGRGTHKLLFPLLLSSLCALYTVVHMIRLEIVPPPSGTVQQSSAWRAAGRTLPLAFGKWCTPSSKINAYPRMHSALLLLQSCWLVVHFVRNLIKSLHKSRLWASAVAHVPNLTYCMIGSSSYCPCNALYVRCIMVE